jgi:WD40 repeat protein
LRNIIKIFRSVTLVGALVGHTDDVTSILCDPNNKSNLLSSSLDGTIRVWDTMILTSKRIILVGFPIYSMVFPSGFAGLDAIFISSASTENNVGGRIWMLSLVKGKICERVAKTTHSTKLSHTRSGSFLGTFERNTVLIWAISKDLVGYGSIYSRLFKVHHTKPLTAFTFCGDKMFAVGDVKGQIICYHGFSTIAIENIKDSQSRKSSENVSEMNLLSHLPSITLHWHTNGVSNLCSSSDGLYLLSGGRESVLVFWTVIDGQKKFIPRLGTEICYIIPCWKDSTKFALIGKDNGVRFVSTTSLTLEKTIQGVFQIDNHRDTCITVDPRTNNLVLNNSSPYLQFYDIHTDKHVMDLKIGSYNSEHIRMQVSHSVFSLDGSLLITIHKVFQDNTHKKKKHNDTGIHIMRFWRFKYPSMKEAFHLVCECEKPHLDKVLDLKISAKVDKADFSEYLVCTIGNDGRIKTWCNSKLYPDKWKCRSSSINFEEDFQTAVNFSHDGTVLATAKLDVHFWNSLSLHRLYVLPCLSGLSPVLSLSFLSENLFVSRTQSLVFIWDLLSLNLVQIYSFKCSSIQKDVFSSVSLAYIQSSHMVKTLNNKNSIIKFFGARVKPKKVYNAPAGPLNILFLRKQTFNGFETSLLLLTSSREILGSNFDEEDRIKIQILKKQKNGNSRKLAEPGIPTGEQILRGEENKHVAFALTSYVTQSKSQSLPSLIQLCSGFLEENIVNICK